MRNDHDVKAIQWWLAGQRHLFFVKVRVRLSIEQIQVVDGVSGLFNYHLGVKNNVRTWPATVQHSSSLDHLQLILRGLPYVILAYADDLVALLLHNHWVFHGKELIRDAIRWNICRLLYQSHPMPHNCECRDPDLLRCNFGWTKRVPQLRCDIFNFIGTLNSELFRRVLPFKLLIHFLDLLDHITVRLSKIVHPLQHTLKRRMLIIPLWS